jgi:hypothetical protein
VTTTPYRRPVIPVGPWEKGHAQRMCGAAMEIPVKVASPFYPQNAAAGLIMAARRVSSRNTKLRLAVLQRALHVVPGRASWVSQVAFGPRPARPLC